METQKWKSPVFYERTDVNLLKQLKLVPTVVTGQKRKSGFTYNLFVPVSDELFGRLKALL